LKRGQQYNVQTFTSAPIQAFAQLRVSCLIHVFRVVSHSALFTTSHSGGQRLHKVCAG